MARSCGSKASGSPETRRGPPRILAQPHGRLLDHPAGGDLGDAQAHQGGDGFAGQRDLGGLGAGDLGVEGRHRPAAQRLALQLGDDAQGELWPDPLGAGDGGPVVAGHGGGEVAGRQDVEHGQRRLGADALDGPQGHEGVAVVAGQEAVEHHAGLLAPLGLDVQHRLAADLRQPAQRARAAAHDVADAGHVDQRVLLADFGDDAPEAADHLGFTANVRIKFGICSSMP
jgi:hypothetical protein